MKTTKHYIARGYVWGNLWDSGSGGYPSETLSNDSEDKLLKQANEMLENGSLDSGMGFESLIGVWLNIEEIETIKLSNGKEYHRSEYTVITIGNLSENTIETLENCFDEFN